MADPKGFMTTPRETPVRRPVDLRLRDWREVYEPFAAARLEHQAGRCMDCGIPFCHNGCPLGNLIPEWNDLVWRHDWRDAADRLHATNNFPEFTGRLCPAPCEAACVLGINADPVTIKQVEVEIIDRAFASGWVVPLPPAALTGRTVAVIEAALGARPAHLSYPYGDPGSAGPREFAIAAELGFKTAVTTQPGVLFRGHAMHLTALPRISLNGEYQQLRYVRVLLSGSATAMWNGFRAGKAA